MGKLTVKEADKLKKDGILNEEALEELQGLGLVSNKRRGAKRQMRTSGGQLVTPQLYFQGLGKGGEYSKKMVEFKTEFNELVNKYSIKQVK
tara:strand:- start:1510 stop:1782 length:273 start_codon:yes stop_codon:yes gene_type:complete